MFASFRCPEPQGSPGKRSKSTKCDSCARERTHPAAAKAQASAAPCPARVVPTRGRHSPADTRNALAVMVAMVPCVMFQKDSRPSPAEAFDEMFRAHAKRNSGPKIDAHWAAVSAEANARWRAEREAKQRAAQQPATADKVEAPMPGLEKRLACRVPSSGSDDGWRLATALQPGSPASDTDSASPAGSSCRLSFDYAHSEACAHGETSLSQPASPAASTDSCSSTGSFSEPASPTLSYASSSVSAASAWEALWETEPWPEARPASCPSPSPKKTSRRLSASSEAAAWEALWASEPWPESRPASIASPCPSPSHSRQETSRHLHASSEAAAYTPLWALQPWREATSNNQALRTAARPSLLTGVALPLFCLWCTCLLGIKACLVGPC